MDFVEKFEFFMLMRLHQTLIVTV